MLFMAKPKPSRASLHRLMRKPSLEVKQGPVQGPLPWKLTFYFDFCFCFLMKFFITSCVFSNYKDVQAANMSVYNSYRKYDLDEWQINKDFVN